jgi:hypothetical protein
MGRIRHHLDVAERYSLPLISTTFQAKDSLPEDGLVEAISTSVEEKKSPFTSASVRQARLSKSSPAAPRE